MKNFINTLLPYLKSLGDNLDKVSLLTSQPWVFLDTKGNIEKLIFKKNNELFISRNGDVEIGRWEYVPKAKSLFINRDIEKILLNLEYADRGLIVLKIDGFNNTSLFLINEQVLPDLNVEKYFRKIYYNIFNVVTFKSEDNQVYEIPRPYSYTPAGIPGQKILQDASEIGDCTIKVKDKDLYLHVRNSKIFKKSIIREFRSTDGKIISVESFYIDKPPRFPQKGDIVRKGFENIAYEYSFKLGIFKSIHVKNGVIQ